MQSSYDLSMKRKKWRHDEVRVVANDALHPVTKQTLELLSVTSYCKVPLSKSALILLRSNIHDPMKNIFKTLAKFLNIQSLDHLRK